MNLKLIFDLFKDTFTEWQEDKAARLAAALAYYTIFSLAPLVIIILGLAGFIFGKEATGGYLTQQMQGLVGVEGAKVIETIIASASQPSSSLAATIIGLVTLLLGASGVFGQLQDALNTVWGVAPKPGQGVWGFIKTRFLSFTMVLGIGFLLLVSLILSAALSALDQFMTTLLSESSALVLQLLNFGLSFLIIILLFAMIFKILPDVELKWRDVWLGATVTALLFSIGKFLLGYYLGRQSFGSTYGAAGSLLLILLWVYYSAQILLFGAEFTQVYAKRFGSNLAPAKNAVALTPEMRARQGMPRTTELKAALLGEKQPQPPMAFSGASRSIERKETLVDESG